MDNKKALPILMAVMFMVMLGFGIIIPVLPFFAQQIGATPGQLGLLMSVYSIMQFLFAPLWGSLSDRIGRKPVMLIGIAGLALSFILFAFATHLWMLFAIRIMGGMLSAANMPTVNAYVADITSSENRGRGMGMIGMSIGLGFIFGPAIGGVFSRYSYATPFLVAGIVSVITFLFVLFVLKESLTAEKRHTRTTKVSRWAAFTGPLTLMFVMQFFVSFSLSGLETTFAYFGAHRAGLNTVNLGYIFMIMGLGGAFVQGGLVGRMIKKRGEGSVIQIGLLVSAIGFALILLTHSFATAAIYLTVFGIGNGVIRPSVSSLITKRTTSGQGSAGGLLSSMDSLGRVVGPTVGGFLYGIKPESPYIFGIVLTVIAFVLYRVYTGRSAQQQAAVSQ